MRMAFEDRFGSCFKLCKAGVTAKCQTSHLNFHFSGMNTLLQAKSWCYTAQPENRVDLCTLSLSCPSLSSHLNSLKYTTPGPARLNTSSFCAWLSTQAHGSLYRLQISMVKIET
jgi:hypothetical protein